MKTKLSLLIEENVIEEAKKYAKSNGKSISSIVEEYLSSLILKEVTNKKKSSLKIVRELKGSVKLPDDFTSYKELLKDALFEKHLGK